MTTDAGPLYEVSIFVAPDTVAECERLLAAHRARALANQDVSACHILAGDDDAAGNRQRICLHVFASDAALDAFIEAGAAELEDAIIAATGDSATLASRVLREDEPAELTSDAAPNCLNCGQRLKGQYCAACGQRSRSRLISLWELITDAFGDLFELDSRLWQTLIPLMIRPGRLTHDYLQGRRARYMPPFRMYLVLSLLFFVIAFFNPRESLSILFEDPGAPSAEQLADAERERAEAEQEVRETLGELAERGVIADPQAVGVGESGFRITVNGEDIDQDGHCQFDESDFEGMPAWIARRFTPERLGRVCERVHVDKGKSLLDSVVDNIPIALIILLPLMAFVLKALYPLSKRYYVEHLLFFVHFHAFFFLALTLQILIVRIAAAVGLPDAIPILLVIALSGYIAAYLFVAMRKVYGQGRIITFLKYVVLLVAYLFGFTFIMAGTFAIAAFSL